MAHDPASQRRRAATAVFSKVLDEPALLQALWLQQETMRGEQASDIINFVDAVARRHLIDATTCKRLYADFFKALREPEDRLPLDPWPAMQALRPSPPVAPPRVMPAAPPAYWPSAPQAMYQAQPMMPPPGYGAQPMSQPGAGMATAAAAPVYAPVQSAPAAPVAPTPPAIALEPPVIFGAVMREVVREVFDYHREALAEVQRDALRTLESSRATPVLQQRFRDAWARARQDDWQLQGGHADLAELTRVLFSALIEAFGRVGADQILQRALTRAEGLPEARQFSPKRLLAAM